MTLFIKLLNFKNKIVEYDVNNLKNNKYQSEGKLYDILLDDNNDYDKEYRKNIFFGKKFDCRLSVIDLLFLKGPESGFFINNF